MATKVNVSHCFGRTCSWCADDLSRFYTDVDNAPSKIFCSPKCASSYVGFESQFKEDVITVGKITINEPDEKTKDLIDQLYI